MRGCGDLIKEYLLLQKNQKNNNMATTSPAHFRPGPVLRPVRQHQHPGAQGSPPVKAPA